MRRRLLPLRVLFRRTGCWARFRILAEAERQVVGRYSHCKCADAWESAVVKAGKTAAASALSGQRAGFD